MKHVPKLKIDTPERWPTFEHIHNFICFYSCFEQVNVCWEIASNYQLIWLSMQLCHFSQQINSPISRQGFISAYPENVCYQGS